MCNHKCSAECRLRHKIGTHRLQVAVELEGPTGQLGVVKFVGGNVGQGERGRA